MRRAARDPLTWILALAVALRLGVALALTSGAVPFVTGPVSFWDRGYTQFTSLAERVARGDGLSLVYESVTGISRSRRPPLYPLLLAGLLAIFGRSDLPPLALQSVLGAATAFVAFRLGMGLFGRSQGLLAALLVAVHPYYVAHDTILQETSLLTLLVAASVCALLRALRTERVWTLVGAGVLAGLTMLCKETLVAFGVLAVGWILVAFPANRLRLAAAFAVAVALTVSPWVWRNTVIHGRPVFTLSAGVGLWSGNSPHVLTHYPLASIDLAIAASLRALTPGDRADLASRSELEQDRWFRRRALEFVTQHPGVVARLVLVKAVTATGLLLSPIGSVWRAAVYTAWYAPIFVLGLLGLWWSRQRWREVGLVLLLCASSLAVFVAAWVHTSHRAFLDVPLVVFASAAAWRLARPRAPGENA